MTSISITAIAEARFRDGLLLTTCLLELRALAPTLLKLQPLTRRELRSHRVAHAPDVRQRRPLCCARRADRSAGALHLPLLHLLHQPAARGALLAMALLLWLHLLCTPTCRCRRCAAGTSFAPAYYDVSAYYDAFTYCDVLWCRPCRRSSKGSLVYSSAVIGFVVVT